MALTGSPPHQAVGAPRYHLVLCLTVRGLEAVVYDDALDVVGRSEACYGAHTQPALPSSAYEPTCIAELCSLIDSVVTALRHNIDLSKVSSISGIFSSTLPQFARDDIPLGYLLSGYFTDTPKAILQELQFSGIQYDAGYSLRCTRNPAEVIGRVNQRGVEMGLSASCVVLPFVPSSLFSLLNPWTFQGSHEVHIVFEPDCDTTIFRFRDTAPSVGLDRQIAGIGGTLVQPFSFGVEAETENEVWLIFKDQKWLDIRRRVRDMYCNGRWDQFSYLAAMLPPGGTLNHDDKGYCIPWPFPASPFAPQNILRFERGQAVCQFADPRADIKCVSEGQVMETKGRWEAVCGGVNVELGKEGRVVVSGLSDESAALPGILGHMLDLPIYSCSTAPSLLSAVLSSHATNAASNRTFSTYARDLLKRRPKLAIASAQNDIEGTPTPQVSFLPVLEETALVTGHVPPSPARTPPSFCSTRSTPSLSSSIATSISSSSSSSSLSSLVRHTSDGRSIPKMLEIVPEEEHLPAGEEEGGEEGELKLLFAPDGDTYPSKMYTSMRSEYERLSLIVVNSLFIPPSLPSLPQSPPLSSSSSSWQRHDPRRAGMPIQPMSGSRWVQPGNQVIFDQGALSGGRYPVHR